MIELCVIQGRPSGKRLEFPPGEYLIGRGLECHVRPESDWVSRQHCRLHVSRNGASISDLGSRNGTLVNGVLLDRELPLKHGDLVQIGPLVFEVRFPQAAEPASRTGLAAVRDEGAVELGVGPAAPDEAGDTQPMQANPLKQFQSAE